MMSDCRLSNIRKILVIRNDGIGDLLNSTPAIAMLRENYADAEITVLAQPLNAPILVGNPDVDRVLIFDRANQHHGCEIDYGFIRSYDMSVMTLLSRCGRPRGVTLLHSVGCQVSVRTLSEAVQKSPDAHLAGTV